MKKRLFLVATAVSLLGMHNAYATACGPYLGIGLGVGQMKTPNSNAFDPSLDPNGSTTLNHGGSAGRVFVGYTFVPYFGLEAGYSRYPRTRYTGTEFGFTSTLNYYANTQDVVAKGYLPIARSGFNLYILAGAARVIEKVTYDDNGVELSGSIAEPTAATSHSYHIRPIYGAGASYDFGSSMSVRLEFTQIYRTGKFQNNATSTPTMNLATLNIVYTVA